MNKKINLQLFAEDSGQEAQATEQGTEQQAQQTAEKGAKSDKGTEKLYTDADVDKIVGAKFAEWAKKYEKKVSEAQKLAEMNAQERAEHERDQLQKELDELKKRDTIAQMKDTARGMLSENKINVPDELLSMLVSTDAEQTKSAVESFITLYEESVKSAVTDALKGTPPKTGTTAKMSKADILNIKDHVERQKAIRENIEVFTGGN